MDTHSTHLILLQKPLTLILTFGCFMGVYLFGTIKKHFRESLLPAHYWRKFIAHNSEIDKKSALVIFKNITLEIDHAEQLILFLNGISPGTVIHFILDTAGGCAFATHIIINIMNQHEGKINVYVPQKAYSGGTIICLNTQNLWANKHSQFTPIETQIWNPMNNTHVSLGIVPEEDGTNAPFDVALFKRKVKCATYSLEKKITSISQYHSKDTIENIRRELLGKYEHMTAFSVSDMIKMGVKISQPCPEYINKLLEKI